MSTLAAVADSIRALPPEEKAALKEAHEDPDVEFEVPATLVPVLEE